MRISIWEAMNAPSILARKPSIRLGFMSKKTMVTKEKRWAHSDWWIRTRFFFCFSGDGATGEAIIGDGIYLHINDTLQYDWTLTEGDKIEWRVFFEGRPQPEITWLDPRGERIAWYQPKNKTTNLIAQLKSTITSLIVRNVSCDQVGEYILQASNGHFTKQTKFRLAVQRKSIFFISHWSEN